MPHEPVSTSRYASFFLLSDDPFRAGSPHIVPEVGGFEMAREALADLLSSSPHACLLSSPPGLGKSALLRILSADLGAAGHSVLMRSGNRWSSADDIAKEVAERRATILLLDDAQDLAEIEVLRLLRHVAEARVATLLAGQPGLEAKVSGELAENMGLFRLRPLRPTEVVAYVEFKLAAAGCSPNNIFSAAACQEVAVRSAGVPRLINRLCSSSLYAAALLGERTIDHERITDAASGVHLSPPEPAAEEAVDSGASFPHEVLVPVPDGGNIGAVRAMPGDQETSVSTSTVETAGPRPIEPPSELMQVPPIRPGGVDYSMAAGASWALAAAMCFIALGAHLTQHQAGRTAQQAETTASSRTTLASIDATQKTSARQLAGERATSAVTQALGTGASMPEPDILAVVQPFRRDLGGGRLAEAPEPQPSGAKATSAVAQALGAGGSMPEPDMLAVVQPFRRDLGGGRLAEAPEPQPSGAKAGSAVAQALGTGGLMPEPDMLAVAQPFRRDLGGGRLAEAPEPQPSDATVESAVAQAVGADPLTHGRGTLVTARPSPGPTDEAHLDRPASPQPERPEMQPAVDTRAATASDFAASSSATNRAEPTTSIGEANSPYTLAALSAAPSVSALEKSSSDADQVEILLRQAKTQAEALKLTTPAGDNAHETYQRILELAPAHAEALAGIRDLGARYAALSRAANDPARAALYARKASQLAPDHPDVRDLLAEQRAKAVVATRPAMSMPRQRRGPPLPRSAIEKLDDLRRALDGDAKVDFRYPDGHTPLTIAVAKSDAAAVELLLKNGADPNLPMSPGGGTPLMYAAWDGEGAIVRALLRAGANPDRRNVDGKTALMAASTNGHLKIAMALLKAGADPDVRTHSGWTALMYAAWAKRRDVVDLILRHDGDVTIANDKGQTASDIARQRHVPDIAAVLAQIKG
jgi:type II secretory pathway predicted ATPase ExeA